MLCRSLLRQKRPMTTPVTNHTIWGILFLSQFGVGFIGNTYLLLLNINSFVFQSHTKKPRDFMFTHLTLANFMTIISIGIPEIISSFGVKDFLDDVGCKAMLFTYRVNRGVSLCTTTFLNIYQAVIITPSNSSWAWLKPKISTYIFPAFSFFWITNMLIYTSLVKDLMAPNNTTAIGEIFSPTDCIGRRSEELPNAGFLGSMMVRDFLCMILMIWSSLYMVMLLHTHRKAVQHVHRTSLYPRASPETKATRTILAVVSCFIFFYWTDSFLNIYVSYRNHIRSFGTITVFLCCCYPSICPFLLIKSNNRQLFLMCTFVNMRKCTSKSAFLSGLNTLTQFSDTKVV